MTPPVISFEMYLIISVLSGVVIVMFAALGWFIKTQFERTMKKLDELARQRTECRESLPERFADKTDTKDSFRRIFDKSDDHEKRITKLEDLGRGTV